MSGFDCPRRGLLEGALLDHWRAHAHNAGPGVRSCSYCGSVHPDDFMQAIKDGVEIGPTDKSYKTYMHGPGFGGAKFYLQHLSEDQKKAFVDHLNDRTMKVGYPGHFYVT